MEVRALSFSGSVDAEGARVQFISVVHQSFFQHRLCWRGNKASMANEEGESLPALAVTRPCLCWLVQAVQRRWG